MSSRMGSLEGRSERDPVTPHKPRAWAFYLVCDVSESMADADRYPDTDYTPFQVIRDSIGDVLYEIENDPTAKEICFLSVVSFSSAVTVNLPLTRITAKQRHDLLKDGGQTDYALVFEYLATQLAKDFDAMQDTYDLKSPVVYFITDGNPEVKGRPQPDSVWRPHLRRLHEHASRPIVVALGLGHVHDDTLLAVRAAPGPACAADDEANPGELLGAIVGNIIDSVVSSAVRSDFSFVVPPHMRRLD